MEQGKIKYIYWFAYYNLDSPSVRYRAKYPLDFAREHLNVPNRLIIPGYSPKRLFNFCQAFFSALLLPKKGSVIVIQRVQSNFIYAHLLKLLVKVRKAHTIYDLDDADYLNEDPTNIHFFAQNCNSVAAGSNEIAHYLQAFNTNVIHVTSPTPDLGILKCKRNRVFTIGWIGNFGWGHKDSLYQYLLPALQNITFNCQLILLGITKESDGEEIRKYFREHSHVKVVISKDVDWHDESDVQKRIKQFDVGIATLLNHPFQRAKSGIKAKQYMTNGVPVISNNLPENNNVVINGYNGFICHSALEFSQRLSELKEMTDIDYFVFSENARRSTINFNHTKWFSDFEMLKKYSKKSNRSIGQISVPNSPKTLKSRSA